MRVFWLVLGVAGDALLNLTTPASAVDAAARIVRSSGLGGGEDVLGASDLAGSIVKRQRDDRGTGVWDALGTKRLLSVSAKAVSSIEQNVSSTTEYGRASQKKSSTKLVRRPVGEQRSLPLEQHAHPWNTEQNGSPHASSNAIAPTHGISGVKVFVGTNRTLPSNYSTIPGRWEKDFPANKFGCTASWYNDSAHQGYPTCPHDTLEVHLGSEEALKAEKRANQGLLNGVSCLKCAKFGSELGTQLFIGKNFRSSCSNSEDMSKLENAFGSLVSDGAKISFDDDGTVKVDGAKDNVYYKWTAGDYGRMTWTIYQEDLCGGQCNTRYVLVDEASDYSTAKKDYVWFTTTNYYETGEGTCDISFESDPAIEGGSCRESKSGTLLAALVAAVVWAALGSN